VELLHVDSVQSQVAQAHLRARDNRSSNFKTIIILFQRLSSSSTLGDPSGMR
jgi:hypothetical protein